MAGGATNGRGSRSARTRDRRLAEARRATVDHVASICSGALLAARAGLLDGKTCTTHHGSIAELRELAPLARVEEDRLFVIDGDRLSSAGVTSGVDLMLHVVAELAGPAVAVSVARYLVVYMRRGGADSALAVARGADHIHPAIHRVQDAIAAEPARDGRSRAPRASRRPVRAICRDCSTSTPACR